MIEKKLHSTNATGTGYASFLQNVDYKYNIRGWLTDINSVNFGQLTPNELVGEVAKGLVNQIENQNIEIRLDVNELNSGIYSEVEIEDESEYTEGSNTDTETVEENRDVAYDEVLATTLTDAIDLSRMGDIVDETNIEQALEDIKSDLETELTNLGVTNTIAQELVVREVENFYLTTWGATLANDNDNDLYAQHFDYNSSAANAQYNGNISASTWRVRGKDKQHYDYNYDDMNRLRSAHYKAIDDSGNEYNIAGYNMAATYDLNGNIETMYRRGATTVDNQLVATAFGVIDNMTYEYASNSNTLVNIYETMSGNQLSYVEIKGFKSSLQTGQTAFTYDNNGNLITDANKDITSITYNHLNLPQEIEFTNNRKIVFKYDAAGVKLSKEIYDNSTTPTSTHDYIGGIEYENNTLDAIYTDEGRAVPNTNGTGYRYEYTLKDHLGNSRVMFCDVNADGQVDENEIIQEDHYYPFGMRHEGYGRTILAQGENFYQFNGTEKVEDFNLDWHHTLFRSYDPAVSRWHQIDPKNSARESAYVGLGNNPVIYSDMLGDTIWLGGDLDIALKDIQSAVPESYRDRVTLNEAGFVQFNTTKDEVDASGDIGVEILYHIVNSTNSYGWNVTDKVSYKNEKGEVITYYTNTMAGTSKKSDRKQVKYRTEEYVKKVTRRGKVKKGLKLIPYLASVVKKPVQDNMDIERYIAPSHHKEDEDFPRPSSVLHELLEMTYIVEEGLPYSTNPNMYDGSYNGPGAHNKAINTVIDRLNSIDPRRGNTNGSIPIVEPTPN